MGSEEDLLWARVRLGHFAVRFVFFRLRHVRMQQDLHDNTLELKTSGATRHWS